MRGVLLAVRQLKYENRALWRNAASAFFTFVFPLMFLVIFTLIFGNEVIDVAGGQTTAATFYVGAIVAFSLINACYTTLAMNVSISRDRGQLKRVRGTPLPAWSFLAGKIGISVMVAFILTALVMAFGAVFYDVTLPTNTLPGLVLGLMVGSATFAALGLAVTTFIFNEDAAPAIVNASILPLLFISDIFLPLDQAPAWLEFIAQVFPVLHLAETMHAVFNPFTEGTGIEWRPLLVMLAWGVLGVLVAVRWFRWEPRR